VNIGEIVREVDGHADRRAGDAAGESVGCPELAKA
jgi:hypothetical protein